MKKIALTIALAVAGCGGAKVNLTTGAEACITAAACGIAFSTAGGVNLCTALVAQVNNKEFAAANHIGPNEVACLAASGNNCVKARQCLNLNQPINACSGNSQQCNGNIWQACSAVTGSNGSNGTQAFDCSTQGLACIASGGEVACANASCSPLSASCSGTIWQFCDGNVQRNHDCASAGEQCIPGSGLSIAHCRGTGPACQGSTLQNPTAALRCEGSVLVSCSDGQEARQDCALIGMGCFTPKGGGNPGCAYGNDCDGNTANTCVNNKLNFCDNGKSVTVDCGAAGFTACDPGNGGRCTI